MHTIDILLEAVKVEATNLKNNATQEEIDSLGRMLIFGFSPTNCIYGQMTGNCYSKRAYELINSSANLLYITPRSSVSIRNLCNKKDITKIDFTKDNHGQFHSPIEMYLSLMEHIGGRLYIDMLVEYIKGITNTFNIPSEHIEAIKSRYEYELEY